MTNAKLFVSDTTPPTIDLSRKPSTISNEKSAKFAWTCSHPCYTTCTVHGLKPVDCGEKSVSLDIPVKSNMNYTFRLEAKDDVGNKASINYEWTTGNNRGTLFLRKA